MSYGLSTVKVKYFRNLEKKKNLEKKEKIC